MAVTGSGGRAPGPTVAAVAGVVGAAGAVACFAVALSAEDASVPTAILALVVASGAASLVRRAAAGPGLTVLGVVLAGVAVWLVPQRPDPVSGVVLAGVFGVGVGLAHPGGLRRVTGSGPARIAAVVVLAPLVVLRVAGASTALLVLAVGLAAGAAAVRPDRAEHVRPLRLLGVGALVVLVSGAYVGYLGGSTVDAAWFGGGVTHGPRSGGRVALTFDDGPNPTATLQVARILDDHGTKGTFFLVGKAVAARPDLARALVEDGQLIGNHSYHHDSWSWLDPAYPELARTDEVIRRATGRCPAYYRPPHGQRTPFVRRIADDRDERLVMWEVSAQDWATPDPALVARRVLAEVRPGSIILLHDGLDGRVGVDRSVLVRALPLILDGLRAKGLTPVPLDQLIGGSATRAC